MQRERRLTEGKRFSLIHREGRGWANRLLVLKIIPNDLDRNRFGFLAGKRIGKAVVRNRVKRRLREVVRLAPMKDGWDIILIARKGTSEASYHQLKRAAEDLLKRARLLITQPYKRLPPPVNAGENETED
jgi:ribonuclease P protein component